LFTIPNFETAGSGFALLNLAFGLKEKGYEIHIMVKHDRGNLISRILEMGIELHVYQYESLKRPIIGMIRCCMIVSKNFKKINPSVIYSYGYNADYTEALSAFMSGIPWVYVKKNMSWYGPSQNSWFLRSMLSSKIICQNEEMITEFLSPFQHKVQLISIGVDTKIFVPTSRLYEGRILVLHLSSLLPIKGIQELISAFEKFQLKTKSSNLELLIGGPTDSIYVKNLIEKYSNLEKLTFVGRVTDVNDFLNKGHVFVQSTLNKGRREGAPIALQEAMSSGLLCIGSRVAGINDQMKGFEEFQYDSNDIDELVCLFEKVNKMSFDEIKSIGGQFRERAVKEYSLGQEIFKVDRMLSNLC
jgi:glycosyltransferase involved in cell wall biosynthesis